MTILKNINVKHVFLFSLLLLTGLLGSGQIHAATAAGKVAFATGQTQAVETSGNRRTLKRGDEVFSGDKLQTAARSRLQISLADGAFVSVQPDSEYQIEDYQYSGKNDGSEKAYYRLFKGGIRAVTGLIGKKNREAYKVRTAVATIGIRGTGHNTRICQGDCPGKEDGLYHNTWEGITYVSNDADSVDVAAGSGVFVRDIRALIQFLNQPPAITAVVTAAQEELTEVEQVEQIFNSGEQCVVDSSCDFPAIIPVGSTARPLSNGITGFFNPGAALIGVSGTGTLTTIDLNALRLVSDPIAAEEINTLLALADQSQIDLFQQNPAEVADFTTVDPTFWGRWTNGNVLTLLESGETVVEELSGNQSLHFIFGSEPSSIPTSAQASYDFIGGTRSTSFSGATIGQGVTSGSLIINFGSATGSINMVVDHAGNIFNISGPLGIDATFNKFFDIGGVFANSTQTFIDGSFGGPNDADGFPTFANLYYEINVADPIEGVAAFGLGETLLAFTTVLPKGVNPNGGVFDDGLAFVAVSPEDPTDPFFDPLDPVSSDFFNNGAGFFDVNGELIAVLFSDDFGDRSFGTVDLDAALAGDDPIAVAELNALLAGADQALVDDFLLNPATLAEFTVTGGLTTARWANGKILVFCEAPCTGDPSTEIFELTGNQSIHFVYGQEPSPLPTLGQATYNLINATASTTFSGASIGTGATSGAIIVDFALSSGSINMVVNHAGNDYVISGSIDIFANFVSDAFFSVFASTSAAGSACNPDCPTQFDGSFFGPGIGANNTAQYIGLEYDISETDEIMGVAGFETSTGLITIVTPQQQLLATTLTGVSIPGALLFINQLADVFLTGDPVTSVSSLIQSDFAPSPFADVLTLVTAQNFDTFNDGTLFITRWSNGDIIDSVGGPVTLNADQGVHLALGIPTTSTPLSGTATYNFIAGSATQTTHDNGIDIADGGITGGSIQLNFVSALAFPNFTVFHDIETFTLTAPSGLPFQSLAGSTTTQTGFFGPGFASSPSICSGSCNVDIGATFAGDTSSSIGNVPAELGVVYRVFTPSPFTGAGGFTLLSTGP